VRLSVENPRGLHRRSAEALAYVASPDANFSVRNTKLPIKVIKEESLLIAALFLHKHVKRAAFDNTKFEKAAE